MTGKEIVDIIEATLQAKGISKGELYEACDISSAQMSNWRRGKNFPLMDTVDRINKFLGIDLLITNEEAPRSGLRIRPIPPLAPPIPGLRIPGNKKPASVSADGWQNDVRSLKPELLAALADFVALAKGDQETALRYLSFAVAALEDCPVPLVMDSLVHAGPDFTVGVVFHTLHGWRRVWALTYLSFNPLDCLGAAFVAGSRRPLLGFVALGASGRRSPERRSVFRS